MSFRGGSTVPNLLYLHRYRCNKVCRVLCTCSGCIESPRTFSNHIITKIARYVAFCHMSSGWFDCTEPSLSTSLKGKQGVQGAYGLVSNLLEPHHYKDSKVCRVLSHEFGVVRLYRTFSIYIVYRGNKVCRVLMHLFKHIEPRRIFSNHIIMEIAKCVEFCHMSSGWFDGTETSLSTSLQGKQSVKGAYALVRGDSSTSNLVEYFKPHHYGDSKVCRVLSHEFRVVRRYRTFSIYIVTGETRCEGCLCNCSGWFKQIEPTRTFSNHIIKEIAKCVEFCHKSSGWFDLTEPSLSTSLKGKQGVQGAYGLVRGGSTTSNLIEPSRTISLQR